MDEHTLRDVQRIELELLRVFARRCEEASLRWYVLGGTLLGAARHGGFIPWDDDIDIGMPRPDYERLAGLWTSAPEPGTAWESGRSNRSFPFLYGKLARTDTKVVETALAHLPIRHAVAIDVFPLDGAPGPWFGRRLHALAFKLAATTFGARIRRSGPRRFAAYPFRLVPRGLADALVDRLVRRFPFDASPYAVNGGGAWGYRRECQAHDRFEPARALPFEDLTVPVPGRWHEYLAQVYGDYRRLPPPEQRRPRHAVTIIDLGGLRGASPVPVGQPCPPGLPTTQPAASS
ncbi:MAG: LicD family protein [Chloroflexota bacterium]